MRKDMIFKDGCVSVGFDPGELYLRKQGKGEFYNLKNVSYLDKDENKFIINKSVLDKYGIELEIKE